MTLESVIQVRLSNEDLEQLKELAKKERLNISAYCRKELSKKFEQLNK
jgi:predicted DNA binding CopG/RHH family protein